MVNFVLQKWSIKGGANMRQFNSIGDEEAGTLEVELLSEEVRALEVGLLSDEVRLCL